MELAKLTRPKDEAKSLIGEQIKRGRQIKPLHIGHEEAERRYQEWDKETYELICELFDTDRYANEYKSIVEGFSMGDIKGANWRINFGYRMDTKIRLLEEFGRRIDKHLAEYLPAPIQLETDFWPLIHPDIVTVTLTRYEAGHYADCAEAAFKHINTVVKEIVKRKTGQELDGSSLMKTAFSANNPIISIDTIATTSGKDIQLGYMEMFAGAMTGIRNPKAHQNIVIGKERAIHFIFFASLLMDTIDIANNTYRFTP